MLLNDLDSQIGSTEPQDVFSAKRPLFHTKGKQGSTTFVSKKSDSKQEKFFVEFVTTSFSSDDGQLNDRVSFKHKMFDRVDCFIIES